MLLTRAEGELDWPVVVLIVLVQGERRDPAESLQVASRLSDVSHDRHDRAMTWLRRLGFLEAGAPHFCLTLRGRVMLAALRRIVPARSARECGLSYERLIESSGGSAAADRSGR